MLTYRVLHGDAVTHHGTWGHSPLLLTSLVYGRSFLPEPIGWLCLQLQCLPSVADLFRLPPLKSGTLYRNTSSQLPRCSPLGVTWKRFYYNNLSAYSTLVDLVVASVTEDTLKTHWLIDWLGYTRDVVLGTCTCTRVVLEYKSRVLVLVLVLEGWVLVLVLGPW